MELQYNTSEYIIAHNGKKEGKELDIILKMTPILFLNTISNSVPRKNAPETYRIHLCSNYNAKVEILNSLSKLCLNNLAGVFSCSCSFLPSTEQHKCLKEY